MSETQTQEAAMPPHQPDSFAPKILSALFYAGTSCLIVFVNKIVLTNYHFPSYLTLGVGQIVATIFLLLGAQALSLISFKTCSRTSARLVFPLPIIYGINMITGLGGTQSLSLPMFVVMRRLSILITMILEFILLGVVSSSKIQLSVGMMVVGGVIAALNDLSFDVVGYSLITTNNICTALNGVVMKKKLNAKELGKYGLMYYNALLSLPFAVLAAYFTGDFAKAYAYDQWHDPLFTFQFLLSCVCGMLLNYSILLCTHHNSALTTTCVGATRNIVVTYVGMFSSGDYVFSWPNFVGINISVFGSLMYTYVVFVSKGSGGQAVTQTKTSPQRQNV